MNSITYVNELRSALSEPPAKEKGATCENGEYFVQGIPTTFEIYSLCKKLLRTPQYKDTTFMTYRDRQVTIHSPRRWLYGFLPGSLVCDFYITEVWNNNKKVLGYTTEKIIKPRLNEAFPRRTKLSGNVNAILKYMLENPPKVPVKHALATYIKQSTHTLYNHSYSIASSVDTARRQLINSKALIKELFDLKESGHKFKDVDLQEKLDSLYEAHNREMLSRTDIGNVFDVFIPFPERNGEIMHFSKIDIFSLENNSETPVGFRGVFKWSEFDDAYLKRIALLRAAPTDTVIEGVGYRSDSSGEGEYFVLFNCEEENTHHDFGDGAGTSGDAGSKDSGDSPYDFY